MKKLGLIIFVIIFAVSCWGGGDPYDIKYVNQSGANVFIKGWARVLNSEETPFLCIENGKTFVTHTCEGCHINGYLDFDTVLIRFGNEREKMFTYEDAVSPTKPDSYEFIPKSSFKGVDTYVFTFTREMYDAATPIEK